MAVQGNLLGTGMGQYRLFDAMGCWFGLGQCYFFDFNHELMADGGIGWMSYPYDFTSTPETQPTTSVIRAWYADHEIRMMIPEEMNLDFPAGVRLYTVDGRLVNVVTVTEVLNQIINVPVSFVVGGCYVVSITDQHGVEGRGLVFVP